MCCEDKCVPEVLSWKNTNVIATVHMLLKSLHFPISIRFHWLRKSLNLAIVLLFTLGNIIIYSLWLKIGKQYWFLQVFIFAPYPWRNENASIKEIEDSRKYMEILLELFCIQNAEKKKKKKINLKQSAFSPNSIFSSIWKDK